MIMATARTRKAGSFWSEPLMPANVSAAANVSTRTSQRPSASRGLVDGVIPRFIVMS
jgi:hypothetical protein